MPSRTAPSLRSAPLPRPLRTAAVNLSKARVIEAGGKDIVGGVVALDRRDHLVDELGVALGSVLHFKQNAEAALAPLKHLIEGRHARARKFPIEPLPGIEPLDLPKCHRRDRPASIGGTVEVGVVHEDELAVLGELDDDLGDIDPCRQRRLKRRQCILGRRRRKPAMRRYERAVLRSGEELNFH